MLIFFKVNQYVIRDFITLHGDLHPDMNLRDLGLT